MPLPSPRSVRLALILGATALSTIPAFAQDTLLQPIIVEGEGGAISGGVGYSVGSTATGLKSGAPITEVPMTVNTITRQELIDRAPLQVESALAYTPGVVAPAWGGDDRYDQFSVRGFDLGVNGLFRDGLINKSQSYTAFKVNPYMLQRIDVLKGPASVPYGSNDVAGLVNMITKRPTFEHLGEARVSYGSHDTAEVSADWGDVNADKTLSWRLTGLKRDGSNDVSPSEDDADLLALGVTWAPTAATSITFLGHYQKDDLTPSNSIPVAGVDYGAEFGDLPFSFLDQQSPWNKFETEQASIGWEAEHDLNAGITLRQNFRYARQTTDFQHMYYSGMTATPGVMNYAAFAGDQKVNYWALDNQAEIRGRIGASDHTLTVGADMTRQRKDGALGLDYYPIAIADPSYDFEITEPPLFANSDTKTDVEEKGIYVQDHIRFGNGVTVTAGLRRSWIDNQTFNRQPSGTGVAYAQQKDTATTGMLGATWDLGNGFIPYASYGESFTTNIGQTFGGSQFEPTEGSQFEAGLRYAPAGSQLQLSAAVFSIDKTNVLTTDPINAAFQVQTGKVRHQGLELEARGNITDRWSVTAGYTYIDAEIRSSNSGDQGNEPAMVPDHIASVWSTYAFGGAAEGFTLGGGLRYVGETWAESSNSRSVDSYVLADAMARYTWGDNTVALNVNNLFDKDYFAHCSFAGWGCGKADGREVALTLSRAF
ncbi:TonB-dependent siderophore receptor [Falsirhodobacter xinxiangensis]|uniref:TonB-dependent siderophore receptor n=1 Tax=Falsirhodobacter xinxiangensis TaxID=2530049 RepID=UPI0010AB2674|nr:TonB-dependent siderophore receptor [Rhodobacter xinxiangensis]